MHSARRPYAFVGSISTPPVNAEATAALAARAESGHLSGPPRLAAVDTIGRLPPQAARKLKVLRAAAEDSRAIGRELSDRRSDAIRARTAAALQVSRLERELPVLRGMGPIAEHASMREAVAQRDAAAQEISELDSRIATLKAARWGGLKKLENWLKSLPSGVTIEMHAAPVKLPKVKAGDIRAAVDSARSQVAKFKADLHAVASACVPAAVVRQRVREQIEQLAQQGTVDVLPCIETAGAPLKFPMVGIRSELHGYTSNGESTSRIAGFAAHNMPDILGVLCWLLKDELYQKLDIDIAEMADDTNALDDSQRAEAEATLLAGLLEIERVEEGLIEAAEAEGRAVQRRNDADPRAVLGLSSSLPRSL